MNESDAHELLDTLLECPQLKKPDVVDRLRITQQVLYVLDRLAAHPGSTGNEVVHAAPTNSATGLPAIMSRLRNGGYLVDGAYTDGGYQRSLSQAGEMLHRFVHEALQITGRTLPGGTDPRV